MAGTVSPRSRTATYSLITGVVSGVLVTGLLVPLAFGERLSDAGAGAQEAFELDPGALGPAGTDPTAQLPADGTIPGTAPGDALPGAPGQPGEPLPPGAPGAPGAAGPAAPDAAGQPMAPGAGPAPGAPAPGQAAGPRTASDVGITPTTIKIGIITPDTRTLEQLGYPVNPGDAPGQWRTYIDGINARGGLAGRKVVPVIIPTDVVDQNKMRETCKRLTEDEKVFAVLGTTGYYGNAVLCIAQEHKTPLFLNDGQPAEWQTQRAPGLLHSLPESKSRTLLNYVSFLDRAGALRGKKIGLLDVTGVEKAIVDSSLKPLLKKMGYTISSEYTFSDQPSEAASQMGVAVNQMRSDGVEVILPVLNFLYATQFVTAADGQAFRPRYFTSDYAQGTSNFFALRMPDSFDGTLGTTQLRTGEGAAGIPQPAPDAACQTTYEKASGQRLDRNTSANSAYPHTMAVCGISQIFARAMAAAGGNPTRATYTNAIAGLGRVDMPGYGGGSYARGKQDGADFERVVVWKKSCRCWQPVPNSPFVKVQY